MLLIKNANIFTMAEEIINNGSILVENGKIKAVGEHVSAPEGVEVIDLQGKIVYPGFVDAHSHLGLNEVAIGSEGRDSHEGTMPAMPHLRAYDGANPLDRGFEIARSGGITTAIISPASGMGTVIAGSMSAIKTVGDCIDEMVFEEYVGMRCTMGPTAKFLALVMPRFPSSRTSIAAVIRESLLKAKQYQAKKEAKVPQPHDMLSEAMLPIINKQAPLVVHVNLKEDIFNAIRVTKEYDVKMVLLHVAEGHMVANDIAAEEIPCLVGPLHQGHTRPDYRYHSKSVATELHQVGAQFAIIGNSGGGKSDAITIQAALAVADGLDEIEALKAITIYPAQIYGIADRVGSIEVGKDADLVICKGNPLKRDGVIEEVYISGQRVY